MVSNNSLEKERRAVELTNLGRLQEAEEIYRELILIDPCNYIAYANLAVICGIQKRFEELIELLEEALRLKPNFPEAHNSLGNAYKAQGDLSAAVVSYRKALQLKPSFPEAYNNLGVALKEQGDFAAAIASYQKALWLKPNYSEALNNLGNAFMRKGDLTAAIHVYKSALKLKPRSPGFFSSLGVALHALGDLAAAIKSHNKALVLNPGFSEAKYSLSLLMLLSGDYENGWKYYEYRFEANNDALQFPFSEKCKRWNGEDLAIDSRLYIVTEQGLGDIIQFIRFVPFLRDQGVNVSLCAPSRLGPLIQSSGIDPLPQDPDQLSHLADGFWTPLLSIPRHLEVSPTNPIIVDPYLNSTPELNAKWKDVFATCGRPVVGINWMGNRDDSAKKHRNIPVQEFRKITAVEPADFLCLQRGVELSDVQCQALKLTSNMFQEEVMRLVNSDMAKDFLEYTAVIANCDLVVTTGSTVAHIASAMGIPTWVLLPRVPDWRWGLAGDASFWYPSMRLFRQKKHGDWSEVVDQVVVALREYLDVA